MQCFVVLASEIEGRLDLPFYASEAMRYEKAVHQLSGKTLGDFVLRMAGGATPRLEESDQHYTDDPSIGVPFLRVQNVSPSGELDLGNVKYITPATNNGLLKRSQVRPGNLVVKITGVGRMAVSAVIPEGFLGNINQHLVVIETENKDISHALAAYLNSDIGEKLASRRSTGGTRPALDYKALLSIPVVINSEIVSVVKRAHAALKEKETEAEKLLTSIDDHVLSELNITLPKVLTKNCFSILSSQLQDRRIDPLYYSQSILSSVSALPHKTIGEVIERIKTGFAAGKQDQETNDIGDGIIQIRPTNLDERGSLKFDKNIYISKSKKQERIADLLEKGEVLFNNTNSQELVGKTGYFNLEGDYFCSNHITRLKVKDSVYDPFLLAVILNIYQRIKVFYSICTNWNNQSGVNAELLAALPVPSPSLDVQQRIAQEVRRRMERAAKLKREAREELEAAKKQVETIILSKAI